MVHEPLEKGRVLAEPGSEIHQLVFPDSGIISIVAVSPEGLAVEAGLFGCEGFGPSASLLGSHLSTYRIIVQVEGSGWFISRDALKSAFDEDAALRKMLLRYVHALAVQTSFTALSNAVHTVNERLARWVLMCDDRLGGRMELTHEFLALMLGVRRPTVTTALHVLEGEGFIRSERGCIVLRDRKGLEAFARDAYGRPEAVYREMIGPMR